MISDALKYQPLLQEKLDILKKNREQLSEEELSNKYAVAYKRLLRSIEKLKVQLINSAIQGIVVPKSVATDINAYWKDCLEQINTALYQMYDTSQIMIILSEFIGNLAVNMRSIHIFALED